MKSKNKIHNILLASLFSISLLAVNLPPALALTNDNEQPINITSDKQSLDIPNNVSTFTDNVIITQGSIEIKADKVVVTHPSGDQNKTVVEGFADPVTFYQMQDNGKAVSGHGQKLRYELANQLLVLTGNAYLKQLDSDIKADRITYLVDKQQMEAFSDKGKRVTTVLLPAQLQDKGSKTPDLKKGK
ncbi:lipopolysaccharide ABC transporter substrate-binding protein LptA [Candidatus Fukatsuia symbiotica]|uniref:Lipopolysaccharide export system protein LptA n=1 Tax=Candidatus Fukatsuia symbiotica TaxID=1878942 RepID=A0A2U8I777_9GAMM|nr:lipopolysaccharide ABC transporter substrate-binding protein LptA [Candidatus Fukatsuia symbiotica]AWK14939.1 lipopolysaccharide ABC transporter substrate-binding protein LptA [Candidatus Fukatsuia symbiotica]MEA9445297.1 lipopolysaccharide ABC transporter substrate-binding protein LptA [Candidatus Fukatsuia symbiotica]